MNIGVKTMNVHHEREKENLREHGKGGKDVEKAYIFQAVWFKKPNGASRYRSYLEAANPIATKYGAHRMVGLVPREILRGDFHPDYCCVIEWPSIEHYYQFLKDPHYQSIAPMREEAIEKVVVIDCHRIS